MTDRPGKFIFTTKLLPALQLEYNTRLAQVAADDVNPPNDPTVSERHNLLLRGAERMLNDYDNQHGKYFLLYY